MFCGVCSVGWRAALSAVPYLLYCIILFSCSSLFWFSWGLDVYHTCSFVSGSAVVASQQDCWRFRPSWSLGNPSMCILGVATGFEGRKTITVSSSYTAVFVWSYIQSCS